MTGNIERIEYYAGLDIDAKYRKVYAGTLQAWQAFLQPYYLASDVPHGDEADTWRESQTDLYTTNPAAEVAEYIQIKLRDDGGSLFYFVNDAETLDGGFVHLTLSLDEWSTYARKPGVYLHRATVTEGHVDNLTDTHHATGGHYGRIELNGSGILEPSRYYGGDALLPQPSTYSPLVFITIQEKYGDDAGEIHTLPITAEAPGTLSAALDFCAGWTSAKDGVLWSVQTEDKINLNITTISAYVLPSYMVTAFGFARYGWKYSASVAQTSTRNPARTVDPKFVLYPAGSGTVYVDETGNFSLGTISTRIKPAPKYWGTYCRYNVSLKIEYTRLEILLHAFGQTVDITNDFSATAYASEQNARTQSQRTAESLQLLGSIASAAASVAVGVSTGNALATVGGITGGGVAVAQAVRRNENGAVIRIAGNCEHTFAKLSNTQPANTLHAGLAVWHDQNPVNADQYEVDVAEHGYIYDGGVYFNKIKSIFDNTTYFAAYIKITEGFVVGMPANDAAIIENALKNGVRIEKL